MMPQTPPIRTWRTLGLGGLILLGWIVWLLARPDPATAPVAAPESPTRSAGSAARESVQGDGAWSADPLQVASAGEARRWQIHLQDPAGAPIPNGRAVGHAPVRCVRAGDVVWTRSGDAAGRIEGDAADVPPADAACMVIAPGFLPQALGRIDFTGLRVVQLQSAASVLVRLKDLAGKPATGVAVGCLRLPVRDPGREPGLPAADSEGYEVLLADGHGELVFEHVAPGQRHQLVFSDRSLIVHAGEVVVPAAPPGPGRVVDLTVVRALVAMVRFGPDQPARVEVQSDTELVTLARGGGDRLVLATMLRQRHPGTRLVEALARDLTLDALPVDVQLVAATGNPPLVRRLLLQRPDLVRFPQDVEFVDPLRPEDAELNLVVRDLDGKVIPEIAAVARSAKGGAIALLESGLRCRCLAGEYRLGWVGKQPLVRADQLPARIAVVGGERRELAVELGFVVRQVELRLKSRKFWPIEQAFLSWTCADPKAEGTTGSNRPASILLWLPVGEVDLAIGSAGAPVQQHRIRVERRPGAEVLIVEVEFGAW